MPDKNLLINFINKYQQYSFQVKWRRCVGIEPTCDRISATHTQNTDLS